MITLAEAKAHLRIDSDDAGEDPLIESLIAAAYRHAEHRTQVQFQTIAKTLVLDGFPGADSAIELPWTPVTAIDSVDFVDEGGVSQSLDAAELRLDTRPIYPRLAPQYGSDWPATIDEPESVSITVTVGYAETPPDVRAALLLIIGNLYENREAVVIGTISSELPMGVEMLLAPYRIHAVG